MTNEITAAKVEFKLDLVAAGLNVLEYVPERIVPPIVIVNSRSPYLTAADLGSAGLCAICNYRPTIQHANQQRRILSRIRPS